MRGLICVLTIFSIVRGADIEALKEKMTALKDNIRTDSAMIINDRPQGFIIGKFGADKKYEPKPQMKKYSAGSVSVYRHTLRAVGMGSGGSGSAYTGDYNNYLTLREYDKDFGILNKRMDELEGLISQTVEIISTQNNVQKENSDNIKSNQEFILKLIESCTGLLFAVGALVGGKKALDMAKLKGVLGWKIKPKSSH